MYRNDLPPVSAPAARAAALRALIGADEKVSITPGLVIPMGMVWVKGDGVNFGALEDGAETLVDHLKWLDEAPAREAEAKRLAALVATYKARNERDRVARAELVARETPRPAFKGIKPALEEALARRDGLVALLDKKGGFTLPCGQTVPVGEVWIDDAGRVATVRFRGVRSWPLLGHIAHLEGIGRVKRALEERAARARRPAPARPAAAGGNHSPRRQSGAVGLPLPRV